MGRADGTGSGFVGGLTAALVLGGAAAGVVGIGLGEPIGTAALAGVGVWALVMLNYWVVGRQSRRVPHPATGGRVVESPHTVELMAPSETTEWLRRAETAARQLNDHHAAGSTAATGGGKDQELLQVLADAAAQTQAASEQLAARAVAVAVIDNVLDGRDLRDLRGQQAQLAREADLLDPGPVRTAKEASARALADQVDAVERLEELRSLLVATLQSLTLRMEAVAQRGGMLLSVQIANEAAAHTMDLRPISAELRAVQQGLDQLETLTREFANER